MKRFTGLSTEAGTHGLRVAAQPVEPGSLERAATKRRYIGLAGHLQQVDEPEAAAPLGHGQLGMAYRRRSVVPGTGLLADVTAKNPAGIGDHGLGRRRESS